MAKYELSPDGKTLKYVNEYSEEMIIPDGVQKIAKMAFRKMYCYGGSIMKKVVLPEGLKTIGIHAFGKCENLESVNLPDTLTKIEDEAFLCCEGLTTISFPAKLKSIGSCAFSSCQLQTIEFATNSKLTEIGDGAFGHVLVETLTIPNGVKKLGSRAFYGCKNLKTVVLPEGIELFDTFKIFEGCEALETINIPASLTNLGFQAFRGCTSLKNIIVDPNNPSYIMKDGKLMTKDLQEQIFPVEE